MIGKLRNILIILLVLTNVALLFNIFYKPNGAHQNELEREGPKRLIIERLHFDEEQIKIFEGMVKVHREQSMRLTKEGKQLHDDMYLMLEQEQVDTVKLDDFVNKIASNKVAMEKLNFSHFQDIKKLCKPNQIEDYNKFIGELTKIFAPRLPKNKK